MTDKAQIQAGDTVKLRSGGPLMTVRQVRSSSTEAGGGPLADVDWFDVNQPHHGTYPLASLRKVSSR
jgi:uncharacterized protein YodC (DUF2158 family)